MKKKSLVILGVLLCSFLIYSFTGNSIAFVSPPSISTTVSWGDSFIMGVMNDEPFDHGNNYQQAAKMELNLSHGYLLHSTTNMSGPWARQYPRGRFVKDSLMADVSLYQSDVTGMMNAVYNADTSLKRKIMMQRPKIEYLCYGQSSTYQCEYVPESDPLWFYSFNNTKGRDSANHTARFFKKDYDTAGIVISRLKANTEQCQADGSESPWKQDNECRWFVKPKIRADRNYIINSVNADTIIAKIYVYGYKGYDPGNPTANRKLYKEIKGSDFQLDYTSVNLYKGDYLEEFYFGGNPKSAISFDKDLANPSGTTWYNYSARGTSANDTGLDNKADIMIEWTGACDMWIDYVKVENDIADKLLKGFYDNPSDPDNQWLKHETEDIAHGTGNPASYATKFYIEQTTFNNLPCIKYVNDKLKYYSGNTLSVIADFAQVTLAHVPWRNVQDISTPEWIYNNYILRGGFSEFFAESFPMTARYNEQTGPKNFSKIPNTLPLTSSSEILGNPAAPDDYDTWLQDNMSHKPYSLESTTGGSSVGLPYFDRTNCTSDKQQDEGNFGYIVRTGNALTKNYGVPFILMAQGQHWWRNVEVRREPTNEEMYLMANLAISYGAKGLVYFQFNSDNQPSNGCDFLTYGFQKIGGNGLLDTNLYNQTPKWKIVRDISRRIKKWEPYIMNFDTTMRSFYYGNSTERSSLLGTYFNDIVTFKPGGTTPCSEASSPSSTVAECPEQRYLQVATFNKSDETDTKYFMIINTRCSPYVSGGDNGGRRFVRVKFDANAGEFSHFNNWKIIDLEDNSTVLTFDKRTTSNLDLGWINPGQGKLYKLIPTFIAGGTLVCDESFSGVSFNCNGSVTGNNKKITIGGSVNINFKDSTGIFMSGGTFKCGAYTESLAPTKSVNLHSQSGMQWAGLCFNDIDTVIIQNTEVANIKSIPDLNEGYGIELVNAKVISIDGSNVYNMSSTAAGIHVYYVTNLYMNPLINITSNTIKISTDDNDGINITPYSWLTLTGYIYGNKIINTSSGGGRNGIYAFDLVGTPIKNNYIENFAYGTFTWYSSLDLYQNTIDTKNISNGWDLYGIVSEYNLSNAYESRLGGSNVLTSLDGRNICLDALDLNIGDGNNIFTISDSLAYHLAGYFPIPKPNDDKLNGAGNCFKIGAYSIPNEDIREYVIWSDLNPIIYDFGTQICPGEPNYCDYYIGGNPNDTVWIECAGGMGGGQKNAELVSAPQENVYKQIYDSLSINMRKKQYELAAQKCMTLLDVYTDSAKTINAVDKLYHTALARDEVSELKSYYESFIQSHPNHTHIIQRMFYYIQKAKAKLGQYESAMQGFQTIMNQFPTSYEGLAAKWDYMATQLLDSLGGQGGSEKETISDEQLTDEQRHERLVSLVEDPLDKYDKKKFTKEDRKEIVNNIVNSFEDKKTKETKRVKELEVKVFMNEATKSEKQEYKTKKVLKEVVRPQTVNTISEHINAVQSDIERVFSVGKNTKDVDNKTIAVIPLEYKLNQNYPNPFNPSTKINYELKNAGYVSLKIYDLLGREIAELVNETKDAGRYSIDFNASKHMMASGIYFYRIKAGEFVDTKRMVLVK